MSKGAGNLLLHSIKTAGLNVFFKPAVLISFFIAHYDFAATTISDYINTVGCKFVCKRREVTK